MNQTPVFVMNTGPERQTGRKAQISNITAAKVGFSALHCCVPIVLTFPLLLSALPHFFLLPFRLRSSLFDPRYRQPKWRVDGSGRYPDVSRAQGDVEDDLGPYGWDSVRLLPYPPSSLRSLADVYPSPFSLSRRVSPSSITPSSSSPPPLQPTTHSNPSPQRHHLKTYLWTYE
ncbi:hypothetical protein NMY22_g18741 [Coprinellus aureogranulatus]|nr:hypothetical protein NMY22_g18741 [Coprinellus aureogranulatus]